MILRAVLTEEEEPEHCCNCSIKSVRNKQQEQKKSPKKALNQYDWVTVGASSPRGTSVWPSLQRKHMKLGDGEDNVLYIACVTYSWLVALCRVNIKFKQGFGYHRRTISNCSLNPTGPLCMSQNIVPQQQSVRLACHSNPYLDLAVSLERCRPVHFVARCLAGPQPVCKPAGHLSVAHFHPRYPSV